MLNGDTLHVLFNENGTSSLTITGVKFNAAGLGLSTISGVIVSAIASKPLLPMEQLVTSTFKICLAT